MATPSDETDAGDPDAVEPTVEPTVDPTEEDGQRDAARAAERRDVGLLVVAGLILSVVCGAVLWNVRWDSVTVTDVLVSAEGLEIGVYGIGCDAESTREGLGARRFDRDPAHRTTFRRRWCVRQLPCRRSRRTARCPGRRRRADRPRRAGRADLGITALLTTDACDSGSISVW